MCAKLIAIVSYLSQQQQVNLIYVELYACKA